MQTFIEIWEQNPNQEFYGNPIITGKDCVTYKLATEQDMEYLSHFEPAKMFYTELWLLGNRKRKLGKREAVGLRNLQAYDTTLGEIEADINAISHRLSLEIEKGRIAAYWIARRNQEAENLESFQDLLERFKVFYSEVEANKQLISDLAASGVGTIETYNALAFFKKMLQKPIHNQFKDNYK